MAFIDETRVMLRYDMPLAETVATDFYDKLKSCTRGYASFDYEEAGYKESPIVLVLHIMTYMHLIITIGRCIIEWNCC